jgi:hypothetical protein
MPRKSVSSFIKAHLGTVLAFFVFGIGFFGYLMPATGYLQSIPGDLGDARFNSVILEHLYKVIIGGEKELWSPSFFYPFTQVLAFSDNHFGTFGIYAVARALGGSREDAFLVWFLVGSTLNFISAYWMLRKMSFNVLAASCGAFAFTFALPVIHQEGHAQLNYRFAIPMAVLAWWRIVDQKSVNDIFRLLLWFSIQFLCSVYLGVFLGYLIGAMSIACFMLMLCGVRWSLGSQGCDRVQSLKAEHNIPLIVVAILVSGLLVWMLSQYQAALMDYRVSRPMEVLDSLTPRLSSYLLADRSMLTSWLGYGVADFPTRPEHQMFIGIGTLALLFFGLVSLARGEWLATSSRSLGAISAISILILVGMSVVVNGYSLYFYIVRIPGLDAIRAVSRIILVILLPVSILVAMGVSWLRGRFTSVVGGGLVTVTVIGLVSAETVFYRPQHFARNLWEARQSELGRVIGQPPSEGSVIYVAQRKEEPFYMTEIDAMIYAQDHKLKTLNGYSGSTPPGYVYPEPCVSVADRLAGYFQFRQVPIEEQKKMIDQVRLVEMQPCVKAAK